MTREELANKSADEVRRDAVLFGLFKRYILEDAHLIFSSGKLPGGCFGCQFRAHYRRWQELYKSQPNITPMAKDNKTYKLIDPTYRVYFRSGILDKDSPAEAWREWINHPKDSDKVKARKALFSVLENPKEEATKVAKLRKKAEPKATEAKGDE